MTRRVLTLVLTLVAVGLAWPDMTRPVLTATDGEKYFAGQLIIELDPSLRGQVELSESDGIVLLGVPVLDDLSRRWRVNDVTKLLRHPSASASRPPASLCDL